MIDAHELGNIDLVRRLMKASSEYVFVTNMSTFAGTGAVGTGTTGTNVTMTLNSNGLALSVDPPGAGGGAALRGSGTYSQNSGTVQFVNSNDLTFGLASDGIMTASFSVTGPYLTTAMASDAGSLYQSAGAYLTTAAASDHAHSDLQSAGAYLTTAMASDAGSLYQSAGAYLTTAMASDAGSLYQSAGAYLTTAMGSDAGSLYQSAGAYLTTAAASDHGHSDLQSAGAYLTTAMASDAGSLYQSAGAYLTTAMASDAGSLYQSAGAYLTTAAASDHTHSNKAGIGTTIGATNGTLIKVTLNTDGLNISMPAYITTYTPGVGGGDWSVVTVAGTDIAITTGAATNTLYYPKYIITAAASDHTHSDLYIPLAGSSAYQTATLAGTFMDKSYSSAFQTATLAGTFMDKSYSSGFQTATLAGTFMDKSYSSAFQTATLAGTFMDKSYSSAFQTATLANTFMDKSYSSGFQTATLAGTFMDKSYSSGFQTATLAGTFAQISNKAGIGTTIGATNGTLLKVTLNSDGINISVPAYITTYVGGGGDWATATTSAGTAMSVSTGAATHTLYYPKYLTTAPAAGGQVQFSDGSGISWGSSVDGVSTTITGSIVTSYLSASLQSAGAYLTTAAQSVCTSVFAKTGFSTTSTAGSVLVGTHNTNGLSLGVPAWLTAAGGAAVISRLEPVPYSGVTRSVDATSRTWWVYPFVVPQVLSFDLCRIIVSHAAVGAATTQGTTANRTIGATVSNTRYAVIYSQGSGDSSRSLQYVTSGGASMLQQWGASMNSDGSGQSQSTYVHFPSDLGTAYLTISESKATTVSNMSINATWSNNYSGYKYVDIPFGQASLAPGNYWIAFGASKSSSTGDSGGTRFLSVSANGGLQVGISGANLAIGQWGQLTNATNNSWTHAAAIFTTDAQGTTASMGFTALSSSGSHNLPYFVLMASR